MYGYVTYGEHLKGGMADMKSCDVTFIENDFNNIDETNENLELLKCKKIIGVKLSFSDS